MTDTTRTGRRLPTVAVLLAAMLLPLLPAAPAHADMAAACPAGTPSTGVTGTHAPAIDCLFDWGITIWPVQSYDPHRDVTRSEFAALLAGMLDETGHAGTGGTDHSFSDLDRHPHTRAIARLADLQVLGGYPDGTFRPDDTIARAQMATLLMQLAVRIYDLDIAVDDPLPFDDVAAGATHTNNIALIAAAGITRGVGDGRFDPWGTVSRGQVTTFVATTLGLALQRGTAVRDEVQQSRWVDGSSPADPGWNDGQSHPDRLDAMWQSFDYARYPLCTEYARSRMAGHFGMVGSETPLHLGFDEEHAGQSCVWTREASTLVIEARQFPGSDWDPDRYETMGCEVLSAADTLEFLDIPGAGQVALCTGNGRSEAHLQMGSHVYTATLNVELSGDNRYMPQSRALAWLAPTAAVIEGINPNRESIGDDWR